jgi:hypothetical protein
MSERRSEPEKTGAAKTIRPAAPHHLRDEAHPKGPDGDAKQPYATELDGYHGEKAKPPEENGTATPRK